MKKSPLLYFIFGIMAVLLGVIMFSICKKTAEKNNDTPKSDTIIVQHTDTICKIAPPDTIVRTEFRNVKLTVIDTIFKTDTITAVLPIEYHYAGIPDTVEVWYHGAEAAIDSLHYYMQHTTEVITRIEPRKPPNVATLSGGIDGVTASYYRLFGNVYLGAYGGYDVKHQAPKAGISIGFAF